MTDRLDSRIRAFVVELVDDPPEAPPFPHSDVIVIRGDHSHRRRAMETTSTTTEQGTSWWRGPRVALAVVAVTTVVVLAGFAVVALVDSDEPFDAGDGLSVAENYFEEFNAGDVGAILAMFTSDVELADGFTGSWTVSEWEMKEVWNAAQGSTLAAPDCTVTEEIPGESITVSCASATSNAQVLAVGATPVPTNVGMIVTPGGISSLRFGYGRPDFNDSTSPFQFWMEDNHPEVAEAVGFGNWTSVETAEQNGILTAQYSAEWATYLEENNCTYRDFC